MLRERQQGQPRTADLLLLLVVGVDDVLALAVGIVHEMRLEVGERPLPFGQERRRAQLAVGLEERVRGPRVAQPAVRGVVVIGCRLVEVNIASLIAQHPGQVIRARPNGGHEGLRGRLRRALDDAAKERKGPVVSRRLDGRHGAESIRPHGPEVALSEPGSLRQDVRDAVVIELRRSAVVKHRATDDLAGQYGRAWSPITRHEDAFEPDRGQVDLLVPIDRDAVDGGSHVELQAAESSNVRVAHLLREYAGRREDGVGELGAVGGDNRSLPDGPAALPGPEAQHDPPARQGRQRRRSRGWGAVLEDGPRQGQAGAHFGSARRRRRSVTEVLPGLRWQRGPPAARAAWPRRERAQKADDAEVAEVAQRAEVSAPDWQSPRARRQRCR